MFYTYAHYKPTGGIFYIGKGVNGRAYEMGRRNVHWKRVVAKYGNPHVEILANWNTEIEAFDHEKLLIASFRDMGVKLVNITDGGEGTSGSKHSEETKARMSEIAKQRPPVSEATRLKLSKSLTGKKIGKRYEMTDAIRKKMSDARKGKKMSEEQRLALSKRMMGNTISKGIKHTEQARLNMSKARKNRSNP